MHPGLVLVLSEKLFPALHLGSLRAVGGTCTALRAAVTDTRPDIWLQAARNTLPGGHPLCVADAAEAASIPARADRLARLHSSLQSGKVVKASTFQIRRRDSIHSYGCGLRPTANHQGTMFVCETSRQLYLHKMSLSPKDRLCRIIKLPSPEPDLGERYGMSGHEESATWAPDDSLVALQYYIESDIDPRGEETGLFQVVHLLNVTTHALLCLTDSSDKLQEATLEKVCFTSDSRYILTTFKTSEGALLEVHTRNGEAVTKIWPQEAHDAMVVAGLNSNRAAVSSKFGEFTVRDLLTGQQTHAIAVHHALSDPYEETIEGARVLGIKMPTHASLLCTDIHGACLAYINKDCAALQLFDAASLQTLGSYRLPSGIISWKVPGSDEFWRMTMGAVSWLLHSRSDRCPRDVQLTSWDRCTSKLNKIVEVLSAEEPSLSEDHIFAAYVGKEVPATIQVIDLRSGAVVLAQALDLPCGSNAVGPMAVTWCGSQLLVTTRLKGAGPRESTDHILVLQL